MPVNNARSELAFNCSAQVKPDGFTCPGRARFYICSNDNKEDASFRSFVGCCDPDHFNINEGSGCDADNLLDATYNGVFGPLPPLNCSFQGGVAGGATTWHDCLAGLNGTEKYIGCCKAHDPCNSTTCLPTDRGSAKFSNKAALDSFIATFGTVPPATTGVTGSPSTSSMSIMTSTPGAGGDSGDGDKIPTKTVVGIAIGCAIAGLLLGTLVAILLLRRRKRRSPQPEQVHMAYAPGKETDLPASMAGCDNVQLGQFLLSPKPDNEIVSNLRSLDALIRQHVENNYHLYPIQQSPKYLAQALTIVGLSDHSQMNPDDIARLMIDARTRVAALQHVITRFALQSTTLSPGPGGLVSMLPPSVAAFLHNVPPTERHRGNAEAMSTAMIKWRQLSAFLLHPNRSDRTPLLPSEEGIAQQAQQLAKELNRFLEPFVVRGRELNYEQENHLSQVLVECARFGYLLFSQPAEYRFNYDSHGRRGGVVVCPGLERVADGEGRQYSKPQVLSAPVEDP
ncbi:hypothetical protein PG995_010672 [Apiospora arundinis]